MAKSSERIETQYSSASVQPVSNDVNIPNTPEKVKNLWRNINVTLQIKIKYTHIYKAELRSVKFKPSRHPPDRFRC